MVKKLSGQSDNVSNECVATPTKGKTVIEIAKSKGIKINERKISPNEIQSFKGCFITGTAAEITPVASIKDCTFEVCEMILDLSSTYEKIVGKV